MKIQILSDLHLEFHRDKGLALLDSLDPRDADALVLAGDLCATPMLEHSLRALCERFVHLVYVCGNHEYYHGNNEGVREIVQSLASRYPGFHPLDGATVELDGVRFGGTTLWFASDPMNDFYAKALNDFACIRGLRSWVYKANTRATAFLQAQAAQLDVVVTHHLPSLRCVPEPHARSPLNRFFTTDLTPLIERAQPPLWIFGHTHACRDLRIGQTRLLCNPMGYPGENDAFQPRLVVEVAGRDQTGQAR